MKIGIFFVISNDTNGSIILFSSFILCVSDFLLLCVYCFHIWGVKVHTRNVFICFECAVSADKYARTRMRIAIISFVFFFSSSNVSNEINCVDCPKRDKEDSVV